MGTLKTTQLKSKYKNKKGNTVPNEFLSLWRGLDDFWGFAFLKHLFSEKLYAQTTPHCFWNNHSGKLQ